MRGFELQDAFRLSEIIDVMDIQIDLNELMDKAKTGAKDGKIQEKIGAQVALLFIKKLYKAEKPIIVFISNITGEDIEAVKKYKPKQIATFITDLFKSEDFVDFFQSAGV